MAIDIAGTRKKQMNAFALLRADHERVVWMLETIENTTELAGNGRDELFSRLKEEFDLHARIEEEIFYPALEQTQETRELTLEAYEEHRFVKELLSELDVEPKDTGEWTAKFSVLKENIEYHLEDEEGEMFKRAREVLSKEEFELLGERIYEAKRQALVNSLLA